MFLDYLMIVILYGLSIDFALTVSYFVYGANEYDNFLLLLIPNSPDVTAFDAGASVLYNA